MDHDHHGLHDHLPTSTQMPPLSQDDHGPAHTAMEHSSMDHSFMDHGTSVGHSPSTHSMGSMTMHMAMTFHFGYDEKVLFDSWKITNIGGLIGSMVGIFIMAALYEGLKYYREYLFWRTYNSIQYRSVTTPDDKTSVGTSDHRIVQFRVAIPEASSLTGDGLRPTMLSWAHALQTCLHIIQVIISYFLMLIFMTYNVWLCLAVLIGAATGYFLFGWKKSVVVDVTEHCH